MCNIIFTAWLLFDIGMFYVQLHVLSTALNLPHIYVNINKMIMIIDQSLNYCSYLLLLLFYNVLMLVGKKLYKIISLLCKPDVKYFFFWILYLVSYILYRIQMLQPMSKLA